ncbi:hypothetical protein ACZ91_64275 [Streptomyces regensis]|nr:hypothetical protein ACZ91_64275 [Streptomyces regensis]
MRARPDTAPGLTSDGSASIGRRPPVQIWAKVTGTTTQPTLRITQSRLGQARVRPGQRWVYPVVFTLTNTGQSPIGVQDIVLTAPEGLWFTENRMMMSKEGRPQTDPWGPSAPVELGVARDAPAGGAVRRLGPPRPRLMPRRRPPPNVTTA